MRHIRSHAVIDDDAAIKYVGHIKFLASSEFGRDIGGNILDLGCAIGTITNAFNILNKNKTTYGIDLSKDAIEVAIEKYPLCKFSAQPAEDLSNYPENYFDVIHARQLYHFIRSSDEDMQIEFIMHLMKYMKKNGMIIISTAREEQGLYRTYRSVFKKLIDKGCLAEAFVSSSPFGRLWFMQKLFGKVGYIMSAKITEIIAILQRRNSLMVYILIKK